MLRYLGGTITPTHSMNHDITFDTEDGKRILSIPSDITAFEAAKLAHVLTVGTASFMGGRWTGQMIWEIVKEEKIERLFPLLDNDHEANHL
jgi:hypothetical protein